MASSFFHDVRNTLRNSSMLQKLLIINIVIFILINIANAFMGLFMVSLVNLNNPTAWLAVPASTPVLITRPWTLITYMFLHEEFFHLLFNMLWLYWMGQILEEYIGGKKLFSTYILGGISGALLYIFAFNSFPLFANTVHSSFALGASASVLAITVAAATLLPDYPLQLFLIGRIPLKYIALFTILLDLINISSSNAGGHIAHIGGALFGYVYIKQLQKGTDIAGWFHTLMTNVTGIFISTSRSTMKIRYKRIIDDETFNQMKNSRQERTDEILDKISKSGYASLTKEEKDFLFTTSKEK